MKEILYESDLFGEGSTKAIFPFKIIVESEEVDDIKTVTVYRKEIMSADKGESIEKTTVLNSTYWKVKK